MVSAFPGAPAAYAFIRRHTRPSAPALCPEIVLHQVDALCDLWQAGEAALGALGVEVPFWATAWPGGQALARYLLDTPGHVRGARVLDLGSGSGICAIAACMAGAGTVFAVDSDPVACAAVTLNAELNGVEIAVQAADPLGDAPRAVDVILAADLWYEPSMARRVTPWLRGAASGGIRVLAADLGRTYLPRDGLLELERYAVPTSLDLEREPLTTTRVFRWCAGAAAAPGA